MCIIYVYMLAILHFCLFTTLQSLSLPVHVRMCLVSCLVLGEKSLRQPQQV